MTESEARRVLGVDPTAPIMHVRQAYLDLVKVWHPDRFEHDARLREKASQSLQRVNAAYAVLQRSTGHAETAAPSSSAPSPSAAPRPSAASTPRPSAAASVTPPTGSPDVAASASQGRGVLWLLKYRRDVVAAFVASVAGVGLALTLMVGSPETSDSAPADTPAATVGSDIELPASPRPKASNQRLEMRPESGTDLSASGPRGRAAISIQNETAADAVVELSSDPNRRRVLYVRGGEKITLLDLIAGEYRVRLLFGKGWTGRGFSDTQGYRARRLPLRVDAAQRGAPTASLTVARTSDELDVVPPFRLE